MCNRVWVCKAAGKKNKNPITVSRRITARCDNITAAMKFTVAGYYEHVSATVAITSLIVGMHDCIYDYKM